MQAIITKFIPAGNVRGSRYSAKCERGSIRVNSDHSLTAEENHIRAARLLCERFAEQDAKQYGTPKEKNPWLRPKVNGGLPDGSEVHVFKA